MIYENLIIFVIHIWSKKGICHTLVWTLLFAFKINFPVFKKKLNGADCKHLVEDCIPKISKLRKLVGILFIDL